MEQNDILKQGEHALILGVGALLISRLGVNIINNHMGISPARDGELLTIDVLEEVALSELQQRIIRHTNKGA